MRLRSNDTSTYPGLGLSMPELKPLLPALVFILSTRWLTVLLELCCLEEEEEGFDPLTPRVQAPLYRRCPSYSMSPGFPAIGFPMAMVLAWVPLSSSPLPRWRPLYKAPFPLGLAYPGYMPSVCLRSFHGEGACLVRLVEAVRGWRHAGL
jgi:hypothetical protein